MNKYNNKTTNKAASAPCNNSNPRGFKNPEGFINILLCKSSKLWQSSTLLICLLLLTPTFTMAQSITAPGYAFDVVEVSNSSPNSPIFATDTTGFVVAASYEVGNYVSYIDYDGNITSSGIPYDGDKNLLGDDYAYDWSSNQIVKWDGSAWQEMGSGWTKAVERDLGNGNYEYVGLQGYLKANGDVASLPDLPDGMNFVSYGNNLVGDTLYVYGRDGATFTEDIHIYKYDLSQGTESGSWESVPDIPGIGGAVLQVHQSDQGLFAVAVNGWPTEGLQGTALYKLNTSTNTWDQIWYKPRGEDGFTGASGADIQDGENGELIMGLQSSEDLKTLIVKQVFNEAPEILDTALHYGITGQGVTDTLHIIEPRLNSIEILNLNLQTELLSVYNDSLQLVKITGGEALSIGFHTLSIVAVDTFGLSDTLHTQLEIKDVIQQPLAYIGADTILMNEAFVFSPAQHFFIDYTPGISNQTATVEILPGSNYTANQNSLLPATGFTGNLQVNAKLYIGTQQAEKTLTFNILVEEPFMLETYTGDTLTYQKGSVIFTPQDIVYQYFSSAASLQDVQCQIIETSDYNDAGNLNLNITNPDTGIIQASIKIIHHNYIDTLNYNIHTEEVYKITDFLNDTAYIEDSQISINISDFAIQAHSEFTSNDYTVNILPGQNYSYQYQTLQFDSNYTGNINVTFSIQNQTYSKSYTQSFVAQPAYQFVYNQDTIVNEESIIAMAYADFTVTPHPDFTVENPQLSIYDSQHYQINGSNLQLAPNFNGNLSVNGKMNISGKEKNVIVNFYVNNISDPVNIQTQYLDTAIQEENYTQNIVISAPDRNIANISLQNLPQGLQHSVPEQTDTLYQITISGTPALSADTGLYAVSILCTDTAGDIHTFNRNLMLLPYINELPIVENINIPELYTNKPASISITAADPEDSTLTFSASNLPPGLSINSLTGEISGIPQDNTQGSYTSTLHIADDAVQTDTLINLKVLMYKEFTDDSLFNRPLYYGSVNYLYKHDNTINQTINIADTHRVNLSLIYITPDFQLIENPQNIYVDVNNNNLSLALGESGAVNYQLLFADSIGNQVQISGYAEHFQATAEYNYNTDNYAKIDFARFDSLFVTKFNYFNQDPNFASIYYRIIRNTQLFGNEQYSHQSISYQSNTAQFALSTAEMQNLREIGLNNNNYIQVEAVIQLGSDENPLLLPAQFNAQAILAINKITKSNLKVYPNPANNYLHIENRAPIQSISIVDITGKSVIEKQTNGNKTSINIKKLTPGIYTAIITSKNQKEIIKFVVKR